MTITLLKQQELCDRIFSPIFQSGTAYEPADQEPARATQKEDVYYGEINFSEWRPKPASASVEDSEQQQETLYAQVKVSQTASSLTQTADEPESVYAQVKKKRIREDITL